MNEQEIDKLIREAYKEERCLPEGLSERLETYIDGLEGEKPRRRIHPIVYWTSGIAAALLLVFGLSTFRNGEEQKAAVVLADTYTDPAEAAEMAENTLLFVSAKLNKGLDGARQADAKVIKINRVLDRINKENNE